jgi:hypothetical protein
MWGYLVGLCHDTVVPEIFMEGVRRFVTCLMFCWSWLTCMWVQLGYFSTLTPDCFQGDLCSYNFCEFQICLLITWIAVWHSYFCVAHSCIIWFDGCTDPAVKSFAWFTEHLHSWNSVTRKQFVQTKMQFLFAWVWAASLFGKYAITLFWLSSS